MGLALWLVPASGEESTALSSLIDNLASTYDTPSFRPHVTLLTGMSISEPAEDVLQRVRQGVASWKAGQSDASTVTCSFISLGSKAAQNNYFQYLFATVQLSGQLSALRAAVRESCLTQLSGKPDDYFPHLSLAYGTDTEQRKASEIIKQLETSLVEERDGGIDLQRLAGIVASEIWLMACEGPPSEWTDVGKISLI